ncbi:uncharacterized protein LOC133707079 isoform X2 [Rosa rugosa]|uniref:uncharacterized protein LOC133707079 isoform X2 n=1 Tax=Rosa rugosa TaxID=74645 RepID=UPI002B40532D|nr:uncharacterized protein LOC133707079 isoform X2 [Rosa rugosa]
MMFRVLTPLRESVWFTRSRTTPSSKMWELSITTVDLSTRLLLGLLLLIRVAMYCKSEMPDDLMVQCEECKDWFHPACVNISNEVAKKLVYGSC